MGVLNIAMKGWSEDEIAYLEKNLALGYTYSQIANGLGRSRSSVAGQVRRMRGIPDARRIAPAKDRSTAAKEGSMKAIDRVAELLAEGKALSDIAAELNTTRNAVKCAFKKIRKALGPQAI